MGSESGNADEHDLGPVTDYPQGKPIAVDVDRKRVVLVRDGDKIFALRDICPHQGAALSAGRVISACRMRRANDRWVESGLRALQCPWHGWSFGLDNGKALFTESGSRVRSYSAWVSGGRVRLKTGY